MPVNSQLFDRLDHIMLNTGGSGYSGVLRDRTQCRITYNRHVPIGDPLNAAYYIKFYDNQIERFHFSLTASQWPQVHFKDLRWDKYWFYNYDEERKELRLDAQHDRADVPGDIRIAAILIEEILAAT